MRVIALILMLFSLAGAAQAQWDFSLEPAGVRTGDVVRLRLDADEGYFLFDGFSSVRDAETVSVTVMTTDAIPPGQFPTEWVTPIFMPLGTFAAGNYKVKVFVCTNAPPPLPSCSLTSTLPLTVFGSSGTQLTVPTISGAMAIALAFAMMALAMRNAPFID